MSVMAMIRPRFESVPDYVSSAGEEAVDLAAMAGLVLDPWEADVLTKSLGEKANGKWAAFEVGAVVPRQNGKGSILEARELAGLFLLGERLLIHSAHQFDTSLEAFARLLDLIENTPELSRLVKRVSRSHGEEGIRLTNGQRIRFRTRTKGGGRGFSCDCLMLDEAMFLAETAHGALLPTLSARPNPQVWYTGSAVDQLVHEHGVVLARVRERGLAHEDGLAYFEWSAPATSLSQVDEAFASNRDNWELANPGMGIRIAASHIALEQRAMDPRTFAVERLGVGDWPRTDGVVGQTMITKEQWAGLLDERSRLQDPVCLAFDVSPDRSRCSVAAAGRNQDGILHVEITDCKRGTAWLVERIVALVERHDPISIVCDGYGPAASLVTALEEAEVRVITVSAGEHGQACGRLVDFVHEKELRHLGSAELSAAVEGAVTRPLGDAWAWSRKSSAIDISPLVAATLAVWAAAGESLSLDDPVIY